MIWMAILRAGSVLSVATAVLHYYDQRHREINPNRIYSSQDAARFLGVERRIVVTLIKNNDIRGKMVQGNYRIPGRSIIEYLNQ